MRRHALVVPLETDVEFVGKPRRCGVSSRPFWKPERDPGMGTLVRFGTCMARVFSQSKDHHAWRELKRQAP